MNGWLKRFGTLITALGILAVGVGALAYFVTTSPRPVGEPAVDTGRLVRGFVAESGPHRIAVSAYGTSRAADEWTALAEVKGTVVELHERFEEGEILAEGTDILRIDDTDLALAVERLQANVRVQEQQLLQLDQEGKNTQEILGFREEQLVLAKADLARAKNLVERIATARSEYEAVQATYLDRMTVVQELQNSLKTLPIRVELQQASLDAAKAQLKQSQRDLERCVIKLPFPAVCISRDVERFQTTAIGDQLGRFLGLQKAEVVAMIEPRKTLILFPRIRELFGPIDLTSGTFSQEMLERFEVLKIPVDVTWRAGDGQAQWRGRVVRTSPTVDQETRTVPIVVEVEDAFRNVQFGVRPALIPGMFCELTIYGETMDNVFVVPRDCLHDDRVYVAKNNRLHIAQVNIVALEERIAVIDSGLRDGDVVVLTDLFPAAEGMAVRVDDVANPVAHRRELPELHSELVPDREE